MFFILIASQELAYEMRVIVQYQQVSITFTSSQSINQSIPLFKHVTPRCTEVLVKTCTCMYN